MSDSLRTPEIDKLLGALERTKILLSEAHLPCYCVYCGTQVGPYELSATSLHDVYEYGNDLPEGAAIYECGGCETAVAAPSLEDTGFRAPCGHFVVPGHARHCWICGEAVKRQPAPSRERRDAYFFELSLIVTSGAFNFVGGPRLFCWLKAIQAPGFEERGRLAVFHPEKPGGVLVPEERSVDITAVEPLVTALRELGFPERAPQVEPVFDSSDGWEHVVLRVTMNDTTRTLDLMFYLSGLEGDDAERLTEVFRRLFDTIGLRGRGDWYNLTGER